MSKRVLDVLAIAVKFNQKPSEVVGDLNSYLAFCFDEACLYILTCMQGDGKKDSKKVKLYFDEDLQKVKKQSNSFLDGLYEALKDNEVK